MNKMLVPMTYTDERGETHFKDVEIALKPISGWAYPYDASDLDATTDISFRRVDPGVYASLHPAKYPHYCIVISGDIEMAVSDGDKRQFKAGDIFIQGDSTGQGHDCRWKGNESSLIAIINVPKSVIEDKL